MLTDLVIEDSFIKVFESFSSFQKGVSLPQFPLGLERAVLYYEQNNFRVVYLGTFFTNYYLLQISKEELCSFQVFHPIEKLRDYFVPYGLLEFFSNLLQQKRGLPDLFFVFIRQDFSDFGAMRENIRRVTFNLENAQSLMSTLRRASLNAYIPESVGWNSAAPIKIANFLPMNMRLPYGRVSDHNDLNHLSGREWIKFTKTWFILNPPGRKGETLEHPAKFPESLVRDFIRFFTKRGQIVIDPFLGTGTTMLIAVETERNCFGIELSPKWIQIAQERLTRTEREQHSTLDRFLIPKDTPLKEPYVDTQKIHSIIQSDSRNIAHLWEENHFPLANYCITSRPYLNQLKRTHQRQKKRVERQLATNYGNLPQDIGNIDDYNEFLANQKAIFDEVYKVLTPGAYLTVITNNLTFEERNFPLAFDTARTVGETWILKDEKIWCQNNKQLIPLGLNKTWYANRHHQYCLIFQK